LIKKITKSTTKLNFGVISNREKEVENSQANISPLEELGWKPRYTEEEGIRTYIGNEFLKGKDNDN